MRKVPHFVVGGLIYQIARTDRKDVVARVILIQERFAREMA